MFEIGHSWQASEKGDGNAYALQKGFEKLNAWADETGFKVNLGKDQSRTIALLCCSEGNYE